MNRHVVITGGSRGIGYATASAFVADGDRVSICGISPNNLRKAERELKGITAIAADISEYDQAGSFIDKAYAVNGTIDVLVNNAGVAWEGEFSRQTRESMDRIVDVNIRGILYVTRHALGYMNTGSVIINLSSGAGRSGIPGLAVYCASKFAVIGFTESLAGELSEKIGVFAVCPGAVATDMQTAITGEKRGIPPEKIASGIFRLAGPKPPIKSGKFMEIYS